MWRLSVGTGLMIALVAITTTAAGLESEPAQAEICKPDPKAADYSFVLKDINGGDVALRDYEGKVLLLDFWATWCAPCKIEIPGFVELYEKYRDDGFRVLGISVDDPVDRLEAFQKEFHMNYPVLIGDGRDDVKDAFGPLYGFPTTLLISRDGTICTEHVGFATKEQFEAEIKALL